MRSSLSVIFAVIFVLSLPSTSSASPPAPPTTKEGDFLGRNGSVLMLHGKPFYEISFNKFDLFWQMLAAEFGSRGSGIAPEEAAARSLATLGGFGFKTIRLFLYDYDSEKLFRDPATKNKFFAAMDRMMDLCDRNDIRVVACLGLGNEVFARDAGESRTDLIARKDSASRALAEEYARAVVGRYRDRATIAMWEIQNELLHAADIGGRERVWNHAPVPTLTEVARFHREMSSFIKSLDPNHLTTTGDTCRTSLWHQNQLVEHGGTNNLWQTDSWEQLSSAVANAESGVDVFQLHFYDNGPGDNFTIEPDGSKRPISFAAWKEVAARQSQPFYLGELGVLPQPKTEENKTFWQQNPDWFVSYVADHDKARPFIERLLNRVVTDQVPLTHWWAFESVRAMDQAPDRMDFTMKETPDFVRMVADANRRLQMTTMGFTYAKDPPSLQ